MAEKNLLARIQRLEQLVKVDPMIIEAETPCGDIVQGTVKECIDKGYVFCHVVSGGNMSDFDLILEEMRKTAKKE